MTMDKIKIPLLVKLKVMAFGRTKYGNYIILYSFIVSFLWHVINLILITFGWILIASFINEIISVGWIVSVIISFLIIVIFNVFLLVLCPIKIVKHPGD